MFIVVIVMLITIPAQAQSPKENWRRVEADNGAVFAIDMNSISHNADGTAVAITCVVDNDICPPPNMSRFLFDCRGHYMDIDRRGPLTIAAPRSVVGRMAALACAGAKDTRFEGCVPMNPPAKFPCVMNPDKR